MKLITFLLAFVITINLNAQTGKVYPKTNIKKGVLKNGLTYYIYNNPSSRGKRSYYLIQNVGAILEEDDQNGISHFLEHMCFKGTKNFPGNSIFEMFEKKGLVSCVNANTGIDRTVYHFVNVPTKYSMLCDKCLFALRDWCSEVLFPQKDIDTERYVILEEKRTRNTSDWRLYMKDTEASLCNSKYTERDVIGTEKVIKSVNHDDFVEYYNKWYRTDLQAIVVMGDVDVYKTENKIKNLFSNIPRKQNPAKRYQITVPDNKEPVYKKVIESEAKTKEIRIRFRHDLAFDIDAKNMRCLIDQLAKERIRRILKKVSNSDILSIGIYNRSIAQQYFDFGIDLRYKKNPKKSLIMAIGILKDILENGFTQEEYDKVKKDITNYYINNKNSYAYIRNENHLERIIANYINEEDLYDYGTELKLFKKFVKNLKLEDIKKEVNNLYSGSNKCIMVVNNDTTGILSKDEILQIEKTTKSKKYDLKKKDVEDVDLMEKSVKNLKGSKIIKKSKLDIEYASVWTLKNGAKVVYKNCDVNGNNILIYGGSQGGSSVLTGDDLYHAQMYPLFSSAFGIESMSKDDFKHFRNKHRLVYKAGISQTNEDIAIRCSYNNVEQAFQLLYNVLENPKIYKEKFDIIKKKLNDNLNISIKQYNSKLRDTLSALKYGSRYSTITPETVDKVSMEKMEQMFKERFTNVGDFTFYIIGCIGEGAAKKLVEKYIGSISTKDKHEKFKKLENEFPKGDTKIRLKYNIESKKSGVTHILNYHGDLSDKKNVCFSFINLYLQDKLTKVIRHLASGTYNVDVRYFKQSKALNSHGFEIQFDCDPERAEELTKTLRLALKTIAERGMEKVDLDIIKKPYKKERHGPKVRIRKDIKYYMSVLRPYIEEGKDITDINYNHDIFESIDIDYANKVLKTFLKNADVLDVIYSPVNL